MSEAKTHFFSEPEVDVQILLSKQESRKFWVCVQKHKSKGADELRFLHANIKLVHLDESLKNTRA